jgi:uncharacterized protein YbjT (DUF2867 family)
MIEHKRPPILVNGAGGEVGSVSRTVVRMLLEQQYPVRAFVRRDDERAEALRRAGAQVFIGDLLNVADVAAALNGCRRVCFSMSLNSYYSDATILMAAAARAQGDIEVFVNISEFEQTFMTFDRMTAAREARLAWLGGSVSEWSPQQRAHWSSEQALLWSGLPVVNIRATVGHLDEFDDRAIRTPPPGCQLVIDRRSLDLHPRLSRDLNRPQVGC